MANKIIVSTRTLHVTGKAFIPFKFSDSGVVTAGKYDIIEAKPGTPVEVDEAEADRLIEAGLAEAYDAPKTAASEAPKTPAK